MITDPIPNLPKCRACGNAVNEQDQFCINCGFPLKGTETEQNLFISARHFRKHQVQELHRKVKNAQTTLFVLAGLFFVFGVIAYFIAGQNDLGFAVLIQQLILAAVFLALGGWAKSKPVVALISGLVLFILVQLISIIDDPVNIVKGIILKVIVIIYLVKGLQSAIEAEKIKKEHNLS